MSILSSLTANIGQAASKVGSAIKSGIQTVGQIVSPLLDFKANKGTNIIKEVGNIIKPSIKSNEQTPLLQKGDVWSQNSVKAQQSPVASPGWVEATREMGYTKPISNLNQSSTQQPSNPYRISITPNQTQPNQNQYSQPIGPQFVPPPPQAASGASGEGGLAYFNAPYVNAGQNGSMSPAAIGSSGLAGTSSKTGLLGGVAAGGSNPINQFAGLNSDSEEERKKREQAISQDNSIIIPKGATLGALAKQYGTTVQNLANANNISNPDLIYAGAKLKIPKITDNQGIIDITGKDITGEKTQITNSMKTTFEDAQNEINNRATQNKSELDKTNQVHPDSIPTNENIASTMPPELQDKAYQKLSNTPYQQIDEVMKKWDVSKRITEMEDMRKKIIAESQAYDSYIKDIRDDSDLPKRLSEKRVAVIEKARDINLRAMELQYNFLTEGYNTALNNAKYELGLYEDAYKTQLTLDEQNKNREEQQRDNARNQIQQFINTGAISEMDDTELNQWAQSGGYTLDSLKAIKSSVIKNQDKYSNFVTKEDSAGNVSIIGIKKNGEAELIKTIKGIGTPSSSGTGSIKNDIGEQYKTRLSEETDNIYSGKYGTKGAREVAINALRNEFKGIDVAKDIYNRVPDNWESMKAKIVANDDLNLFIKDELIKAIANTDITQ